MDLCVLAPLALILTCSHCVALCDARLSKWWGQWWRRRRRAFWGHGHRCCAFCILGVTTQLGFGILVLSLFFAAAHLVSCVAAALYGFCSPALQIARGSVRFRIPRLCCAGSCSLGIPFLLCNPCMVFCAKDGQGTVAPKRNGGYFQGRKKKNVRQF